MIKMLKEKSDFRNKILALAFAGLVGVLLPQLNTEAQVFVVIGLMFTAAVAAFAVFRFSLNPAWVFVLVSFLELVGFALEFVRPGLTIIWLIIVVPFPFLVITLIRQPGHIVPVLKKVLPWFLLAGYAFISVSWSPDPAYGLRKVVLFLVRGLIPGMYILLLCRTNKDFSWRTVLIVSIVYSMVMLVFGEESPDYPGRVAIPAGNPILAARACFMGTVVALWYRDGSKLLRATALVLSIVAAWKTGSRGPLVAFIAANVITATIKYFADVFKGRLTWSKVVVSGLVLVLLVGAALFPAFTTPEVDFGTRYNALKGGQYLANDQTFTVRIDMYKEAVTIFLQHPLLGVGFGGYSRLGSYLYPHNLVLEIAAELGLIGLFLWVLAIIRALIGAMHNTLVFILLLMTVIFSFATGDFGGNSEYVLVSLTALGLAPVNEVQGKGRNLEIRGRVQ